MAQHHTPQSRPTPEVVAAVFDFDGTLVASRSIDEAAVAALIRADPSAAVGADLFWSHDGEPLVIRIELAWPERVEEILPLFDSQGPSVPFPGIVSLLQWLEGLGLALGVVSSRRRSDLEKGLADAGLRHHFRVVVGLDDVSEPKPSPEGLLHALRGLDVEPPRAVFIGDNDLDVEAGRRAGVTTWRALWGLPSAHPLPLHPAGVELLRSPEEVSARLERLRPGA